MGVYCKRMYTVVHTTHTLGKINWPEQAQQSEMYGLCLRNNDTIFIGGLVVNIKVSLHRHLIHTTNYVYFNFKINNGETGLNLAIDQRASLHTHECAKRRLVKTCKYIIHAINHHRID